MRLLSVATYLTNDVAPDTRLITCDARDLAIGPLTLRMAFIRLDKNYIRYKLIYIQSQDQSSGL